MRTKIVVPMVLLAVGPALAIGIFMISRAREILQESVVRRVAFDTADKARAVQEFVSGLQQDIRFLSQTKALRDLAATDPAQGDARLAELRRAAERDFLFFQRGHAYCQAQCLSAVGQQLIRLDARGGILETMPSAQLDPQGEQAAVKAALKLRSGQVYVSPMHLDLVHGMTGAVMTFATPVSDDADRTRGLLAVGVCADHILAQFGPLPGGMEAWLVSEEGNYLGYVGEAEPKRLLYRLETQRRLSADYPPEHVAALRQKPGARPALKTAEAMIFSAPITLQGDNGAQTWTLLISYPRAPIEQPIRHLTWVLGVVTALIATLAGLLGVFIAHYLARPVASLRRATRDIAAGDLSKRVEITTADEIEALAADFNTMTERLSEAQARLSQWNVELEREVARQTDKVRQLQTGLARADKLASIGQITAGVMHEIGNPLAAIKTKIQVAEEAGALDAAQQELLNEILVEVNRLTVFLRSFSRLARLRDHPAKAEVSLAEVADSVLALLVPDLKRRRVTLHLHCDPAVPKVRGDIEQLRHLLMNLILNAADASPSGGEIVVRVQPDPGEAAAGRPTQARLQVVDHGTGVSPDLLEKIWHPFFTTKPEGTGLGLAISRQIVQEHGGRIQMRSAPGRGTEVAVVFPAWRSEAAAVNAPEPGTAALQSPTGSSA